MKRSEAIRTLSAGVGPPDPLRGFIERVVVPLLLERFLREQAADTGPSPDSPADDMGAAA